MNVEVTRQFLKNRAQSRKNSRHHAWLQASEECDQIIQKIATKYNPLRIWQWGSLLHQNQFNERSDIDLAIEGVTSAPAFFALLGDALALTSRPLDIVQMEKIEPEFASIIRLKGKIVYEREP